MIGNLIGALVGKEIDESDGEGGAAGAVLGVVGWQVLKRVVPALAIGAVVLVAGHYVKQIAEE
ncbi:hypothetical protein [Sphingomonas morindae]|uniref:Uncharacterized protein n=1 Tax=Sphingomonas morindae TaxID=1541170 RepID=A0ABY4XB50_9SPHN|nr:hypothetical protein [Sphingomonas morindae]USI74115.1 hypothetical protein LHA26_06545 [Sphingomonas morindae]